MPHEHRRQRVDVVEGEVILAERADALMGRNDHAPGRRLQLTREAAQERRLAGAVGAD
jgi:hypothetical protein